MGGFGSWIDQAFALMSLMFLDIVYVVRNPRPLEKRFSILACIEWYVLLPTGWAFTATRLYCGNGRRALRDGSAESRKRCADSSGSGLRIVERSPEQAAETELGRGDLVEVEQVRRPSGAPNANVGNVGNDSGDQLPLDVEVPVDGVRRSRAVGIHPLGRAADPNAGIQIRQLTRKRGKAVSKLERRRDPVVERLGRVERHVPELEFRLAYHDAAVDEVALGVDDADPGPNHCLCR